MQKYKNTYKTINEYILSSLLRIIAKKNKSNNKAYLGTFKLGSWLKQFFHFSTFTITKAKIW